MTCPHCGATVKPTASFCIRCGRKLVGTTEAAPGPSASESPAEQEADRHSTQPVNPIPTLLTSESLAQLLAAETREMSQADVSMPPSAPLLAVGSHIGEHYEITRIVEQGPDGVVYEALDLWTQDHCWSCGQEWNDGDDENFCEHCGAQRRGKTLLLRQQTILPDLLTEAATIAPNAIFYGDQLLVIIGEEDVPITAKRGTITPPPSNSVPPGDAATSLPELMPFPMPVMGGPGDTQPQTQPPALPVETEATMELSALSDSQPPPTIVPEAASSGPNESLRAHMLNLPATDPNLRTIASSGENFAASQSDSPTIEEPYFEATMFLPGSAPRWEVRMGVASDVGRARQGRPNEDTALALTFGYAGDAVPMPLTLGIVADGLGGHENGQRAGRLAARIIVRSVLQNLWIPLLAGETAPSKDPAELGTVLRAAILEANVHLCKLNRSEGGDMGCTVTALIANGEAACVANVGDSRTYLCSGRELHRVTTDHSLVARLVAAGMLNPDDVYTHPQRSQIYRSLGDEVDVQVDLFPHRLRVGESFILCSDGLWEMVRDPQIERQITHATLGDPQALARQLISMANEHGGEDNVSVVVAQVVS
jgi:serine/threonine protein phosphatase PrpC